MNTIDKYEDIKISMLPEKTRETLEKLKKATKDFTIQNDKADAYVSAVHSKLSKEKPEVLRSKDKKVEPKKTEPKKPTAKKSEPKKAEPKKVDPKKVEPTKAPIKKATKTLIKTVSARVNALKLAIDSDPLLKGLSQTDKERDAGRLALPKGRRVSKKTGKVYYESRENRSDRKSPEYKSGYPYLEMGGDIHPMDKDGNYVVQLITIEDGKITDVIKKTYRDEESALTYAMMKGNFLEEGQAIFVNDENNKILYKKVSMRQRGYMEHGGEIGTWKPNALQDGSLQLTNSNIFIRDNGGDYGRGRYDVYRRGTMTDGFSTPVTLIASIDDLDEAKKYGYNNRYERGGYMEHGGDLKNKLKEYKTFVEEYPDKQIYVRVKFGGADKDVQRYTANEENKKRAIDFAKRLAEKNNGTYEGFKTYTLAKGGYMENGGETKFAWMKAQAGDSAVVIEENKMGVIVKPYGRRFHLRFPDGSEKTYFAEELYFIFDEEYAKGGELDEGFMDFDETHINMAKGGLVQGDKLPHKLTKYFTKGAKTIEVPMDKLSPTRAREKGIENAEKYMRMAYNGEMDKRKPISVYRTTNGRYKVADGNSTYAVAKKNGWKTILADVVKNPLLQSQGQKSVFGIAKEIRKDGESWQDAIQRAKKMKK